MKFIKDFEEVGIKDIGAVGGKTASLGQMIQRLSKENIRVPGGFAVTAQAYFYHLQENDLKDTIVRELEKLKDPDDLVILREVGKAIREIIYQAVLPPDLVEEIKKAYQIFEEKYGADAPVAVRSSATAEDLPHASFAGQQETYLGVEGESALLDAVKKCMASLFTDRAIIYRVEQGFDHLEIGLSVAVQKLVRASDAASGVMFTLDTETGFKDVIMIDSSWGFGETVVKGTVIPDEFFVHKPTLEKGYQPIIDRNLGSKEIKIIFSDHQMKTVDVDQEQRDSFSLSSEEILELARAGLTIENLYSKEREAWAPMDIEWAKDGVDGKLYIVQARPETVHAREQRTEYLVYSVQPDDQKVIVTGTSIGRQITGGKVRVASSIKELDTFSDGDILVTQMTDPDWVPIMKKAGGIITDRGGRTCHAAIVSRELGIPAIIGTHKATSLLKKGQEVTLDCSRGQTGYIYDGLVPFEVERIPVESVKKPLVDIMVNLGEPDRALEHSFLPVEGVGLARIEFIMSAIGIHPMAVVEPEKIEDAAILEKIQQRSVGYKDARSFFVDSLAQGIGKIAAAFYPRPVIVRLSDFKSNEYRDLLGGNYFEPIEENPMLGFRGAFRYNHPDYKPAFALECEALHSVRSVMGLKNVRIMIPFVRTVSEAHETIELLAQHNLRADSDELKLFIMGEIPSNVILIDQFAKLFDGVSIGSNDLTQLALGVDRDSALLGDAFDERNQAVKVMLALIVQGAKRNNTYVSICGQAPSDYPELAQFLIEQGIDSLSLNPDAVLPFLKKVE